MSHTTMTLPALYEYAKNVENIDIFENLTLPASMDRDTLIYWILHRSMPFEVTYPNSSYMHFAVGTWSKVHERTIQKWCDALALKYEPLHNYDRTEEFTESGLESRGRQNETASNSLSSSSDKTETDTDVTNQVSPFDSAAWNNTDKSTSGSDTKTSSSNIQRLDGSEKERENTVDSRQHKLRAFGNIGVTTSMQLIESELELDAWNLYEHITDLFLDEFCVLLY